jgi:simple sugar transport system ATP-binding protein
MRLGRVVAECRPSEKTAKELAELMINAELAAPASNRAAGGVGATPRLTVAGLSLRSPHVFGTDLQDVRLSVAPGEILGIAGIAGNGQTELMDALSGEVRAAAPDQILLDGIPAGQLGPRERRKLGSCFVPEERNGHGAVTSMTLAENAFLSAYVRRLLARMGLISQPRTLDFAREIIARFDVRTTGPKAEAGALSGGNLQKFLVGREVLQAPGVLVINQPTWGVDAGAAAAIHRALIELAETGTTVVIISQDLDEIFLVCDRVAVIAGGRLSPPVAVKDATVEQIGLLMGGAAIGEKERALAD